MRLSDYMHQKPRLVFVAMLSCVLAACNGSGNQDPILGSPSITSAPRVVSTLPAKLIPIVSDVPLNMRLAAKFSRDMSAASLNSASFNVACPAGVAVSGTVTYHATSKIAVLRHAADFPASTTCVATITTAATDTAGIALAKNYVWSFTTGTNTDTAGPALVSISPADTTTGVCLSKNVNATFNEAIDPSSLSATTFDVTDSSNVSVPGVITYDTLSNTATFAVTTPPGFTAGATYTLNISTGVTDLAGNALATASATTFTTGTQACSAPAPINLGTIATYGAFGGGAGTTNSGINTIVNGDLGTTAACTLFTGFHDAHNVYTETPLNIGEVTGDIYCGPPAPGSIQKLAIAKKAADDALTAYNALAAKTPSIALDTGELGLRTLLPGTYTPAAYTLLLSTGNLTLDAAGDADAVWIFQVPSSLTIGQIGIPRRVILARGAQAKNVYWQVGSAARIENGSTMVGTIIASAGVTISTAGQTVQTTLTGRAIGLNASVTMVNTTIVAP